MKLEGKVAIVTGGGRGLGREIALAFAGEGANLALAARTRSEIDAVAREATALGRKALSIPTDVQVEEQINRLVEKTVAEFGRVDILVNDAGGSFSSLNVALKDLSLEKWRVVLDTNLTAAFLCSKAVLKYMIEQKSGNIINITSGMGQRGKAGASAYCAAKFGMEGLTQVLAMEMASFNIRVNALHPGGAAATQPLLRNPQTRRETLLDPQIMRPVTVYLASDDSIGVTGQSFSAQEWLTDQEDRRRVMASMGRAAT